MLCFLVETRPVTAVRILQCSGNGFEFAGNGHINHTSDLEFMKVAKTFDRSVPVVITRREPASEAAIGIGVRRWFYHSEGNRCRGVEKPSAMYRSDLWISILKRVEILFLLTSHQGCQ